MLFVSKRLKHVVVDVQASFLISRSENYAAAGHRNIYALENVIVFVDGAKIKISRPSGANIYQRLAYNVYKRIHAINFQPSNTPCGIAMHLADPMEGLRQN